MRKPLSDHERAQNRGRAQALKLYPVLSACEGGCGAAAKHRHHIDHDCQNNDRSNLLFLCAKCHTAQHPEIVKAMAAVHRDKTHCPHGHPYSGENLLVAPDGARKCKECNRERALLHYHARKGDPAYRAARNKRNRLYHRLRRADPEYRAAVNERERLRYQARKARECSGVI